MSAYPVLKWLHVLSSVVLVGTGFGTAYFMYFANRSASVPAQAVVTRLVVRADLWFTTPAVVLQPLTGIALASLAGWPLTTPWIALSIGLYLVAGACWLPVVRLQMRLRDLARAAHAAGSELAPVYWVLARRWERLGYPAFIAMVAVFYLMVAKSSLGV